MKPEMRYERLIATIVISLVVMFLFMTIGEHFCDAYGISQSINRMLAFAIEPTLFTHYPRTFDYLYYRMWFRVVYGAIGFVVGFIGSVYWLELLYRSRFALTPRQVTIVIVGVFLVVMFLWFTVFLQPN